jgi:hypothetical protein
MRFILAAMLVGWLVTSAHAQKQHRQTGQSEAQQQQIEEKKKKARETENAYKGALERIPEKKPVDPWGNMR